MTFSTINTSNIKYIEIKTLHKLNTVFVNIHTLITVFVNITENTKNQINVTEITYLKKHTNVTEIINKSPTNE